MVQEYNYQSMMKVKNIKMIMENDMAVTMIELQKLKAIILERVIEHLQEQADSENEFVRTDAEFLLGFIGSLMIEELLKNKEEP
jgi:HEAT repeat protein